MDPARQHPTLWRSRCTRPPNPCPDRPGYPSRLPERAGNLAAVASLLAESDQAGVPVPAEVRAASATLTRWAAGLRAPRNGHGGNNHGAAALPVPGQAAGHVAALASRCGELAEDAKRAAEQLLALASCVALHGELPPWGAEQAAAALRGWACRRDRP